jgi:hypothetical protein
MKDEEIIAVLKTQNETLLLIIEQLTFLNREVAKFSQFVKLSQLLSDEAEELDAK